MPLVSTLPSAQFVRSKSRLKRKEQKVENSKRLKIAQNNRYSLNKNTLKTFDTGQNKHCGIVTIIFVPYFCSVLGRLIRNLDAR